VESEAKMMTMDRFNDVEIGIVVSLGTLRGVLKTLSVDGKRWWIASRDPSAAMENGAVTVGLRDARCIRPLKTVYFRIPIVDPVRSWSTDRILLLFDPTVIVDIEPGYFLERGRFVQDCVGDFENFFFPIKRALLDRLRSAMK